MLKILVKEFDLYKKCPLREESFVANGKYFEGDLVELL